MRLSLGSHQVMSLLCLVMLLCAFTSGVTSHDSKFNICCKPKLIKIIKYVPKDIKRCFHVSATSECVKAVVFGDTNNKIRCFDPEAPWLDKKLKELEEKGVHCRNGTKS